MKTAVDCVGRGKQRDVNARFKAMASHYGFVEHSKRVSPTCLVTFKRNRNSVPARFANWRISLHVYPEQLVVVVEGQTVCTHDASLIVLTASPAELSAIGAILWVLSNANLEHYAMVHRLQRCLTPSAAFKTTCYKNGCDCIPLMDCK